MTHVLDLFVCAWREQEERRRQKEEEEAALFHFKEKTHGDFRTEAEKEEVNFKESFPSYHEDFSDMVEATRLEDTGRREQPMEEEDEVVAPDTITEEEMDEALLAASPKCYNIYTDPNVAEVIQCRPVLRQMVVRVTELQQEWPEHPTLKQHWESNASRHVSMATQLAEVTAVIVRWRKLELSCWSGSLDIEVERCRRRASRWWFHLYNLTSSFLSEQEQETGELLKSLKQFMESSSMGEFSARLNILLAFHCQLVNMEPSQQRDLLLCVLWNIHQFYKQFQVYVDAEISRLRAPIEKELKGFVKIARWSDMNYWALKESTEKTHRTVHKHTRAFQAVLNQPVKSLLGEKPSDRASGEMEDTSSSYCEKVVQYQQQAVTRKTTQLHTGPDKEKQRAEARHINLRKRKALSDLFKQLTALGLSYRKGLNREKSNHLDSALLVQPLNPSAALEKATPLVGLWERCDVYFSRCLSRLAQLSAALQSPSKRLVKQQEELGSKMKEKEKLQEDRKDGEKEELEEEEEEEGLKENHLMVITETLQQHASLLQCEQGFCLPAEYSDEAAGEGATEFVDIEGGGIGEGEGSKDVSEQIESEDQLDEARRPDDKQEEDQQQSDLKSEDNAIEMSDDFDAKLQDLEPVEGDDDDEKDNKEEDEDMDKQMGEVEGPDSDRLDDQMWGSDEEDESKEENSANADKQGEKEEDKKQDEKNKDNEQQKPHELEEFDESEYDDNKTDPYHGDQKQQEEPENLDLPEDLNLDQDEKGEEAEAGGEEPPDQPDDTTVPEPTEDAVEPEPHADDETVEEGEERKEEERLKEEEKKMHDNPEDEAGEDGDEADKDENEKDGKKEGEDADTNEPDTAQDERKDDQGEGDKGLNPQDEESKAGDQTEEGDEGEKPEGVDDRGKTTHDTPCAVQSDTAQDETAGQNDQEEEEGDRKDGREADMYEHITDDSSHADAQTLDAATDEQQQQQQVVAKPDDSTEDGADEDEDVEMADDEEKAVAAAEAWQKYETLTAGLSQELCEQLRLILEPSQATKLKGDYRTGKRLNMRKVIPYIASQFRKDKIWLRRTKPSKRQYQIMLAIDDSSSMADNHSKQMLQQATAVMLESRSRQQGSFGRPETAQLVLIVSDGRGMFAEGRDVVKMAVRRAREANIFLAFIILDEPTNKIPEIRSYMEDFPFPFYVILRDINALPQILSDALRQWFELVTASTM
nr:hypothetical protein BaRGS_025531 [Batillaria attramentaria]